jgi:hypothetical protein
VRSAASATFARGICLVGVLACFAVADAAAAAEPKPDAAIESKAVQVKIFLDDKIKADPALAADCLAEGRKWAEKARADAERERKASPDMFRNGAWAYERKYRTRSVVAERYISIVRDDYTDTGGAHPNTDVNTILWDRTAGKRISIRPFFTETADDGPTMKAMLKGVIASLDTEKKRRGVDDTATPEWYRSVQPSLLKIGAVTLAPSTEPGKGARIFGGARPGGDDDGTR